MPADGHPLPLALFATPLPSLPVAQLPQPPDAVSPPLVRADVLIPQHAQPHAALPPLLLEADVPAPPLVAVANQLDEAPLVFLLERLPNEQPLNGVLHPHVRGEPPLLYPGLVVLAPADDAPLPALSALNVLVPAGAATHRQS